MGVLPNYNVERKLNYITKDELKKMKKIKPINSGHTKEEMIKLIESIENGTFDGVIDCGGESFDEFMKNLKDEIYGEI